MAERAHPDDKGFQTKWFGLKRNKYRENLIKRYESCNKYIQAKDVLDIPCGMGWGTSMLEGYKSMSGVDIDPDAIEEARSRYQGIDFEVGNMTDVPYPDANFDVIICLEGFEHITYMEGQKFLNQCQRLLRPRGQLIMTVPLLHNRQHSGNKFHLSEYLESELRQILTERGELVQFDKIDTPEGETASVILKFT